MSSESSESVASSPAPETRLVSLVSLAGTGWAISLLLCMNQPCGASISDVTLLS